MTTVTMETLNRHAFCSLRFALCVLCTPSIFDQSDSCFFSNISAVEKRQQWRKKAASSNSSAKVILSSVEEGKLNRTAQYHTPFVIFYKSLE